MTRQSLGVWQIGESADYSGTFRGQAANRPIDLGCQSRLQDAPENESIRYLLSHLLSEN